MSGRKAIQQHKRWERSVLSGFVDAVSRGDFSEIGKHIEDLDTRVYNGWKRAFRRVAKLNQVEPRMQQAWLDTWINNGDHIRQETGNDLVLIHALRVLLPPYRGPAMTLYRGESMLNRRRRTYGACWSSDRDVAMAFAEGTMGQYAGGSVLLQTLAQPDAIICAPAHHGDSREEAEYLVDRRRLSAVTVLERYPPA
jgi:hypothetical protein